MTDGYQTDRCLLLIAVTHQTIVRQRYTTADFDVNSLADY